ncbi:MAG: hypothetical protein LBK04_04815 [Clostridiales Family XIII bacterium]|jgi:hypothetical protein|nr:hypothetical protein [Clostridiales Family XIII bacterium]
MNELRIILLAVLCLPILVLAVVFFVSALRQRLPGEKQKQKKEKRR